METGRVIHRRYLLQRMLQQGQACTVYKGFDQVLQRAVAVKVASGEHIPVLRAAIRATSQFSHPNIVGLYDLIVESEALYAIQEYVEGDNFSALLQTQLSPYQVANFGLQICQALLYAGGPSRKICHGDLTPSAIIRDSHGIVRVNNFALTPDLFYFTAWSVVGGNGIVISDQDLPCGQLSEGRRGDDTRAVGLLMYQLLAGRTANATTVEPPSDGRLRFLRNVPAELCEVIARAVVRQHPQRISTPEAFRSELKQIAIALEPHPPVVASSMAQKDELVVPRQFSPASSKLVTSLPVREASGSAQAGFGFSTLRTDTDVQRAAYGSATPAASTLADVSMKLAAARQAAYREPAEPARRVNLPVLLLAGFVLFAVFFTVGYFLAHALFP